ncbi:FkbM family methyltransferase [Ferruginibacter sp. SUN002]|uniref:FkbM family methyltransferase n=1 Tax=Ferruginibacter sp. SUN002 TaxID=2937789 RepID=UPI003D36A985
MNFKQFIPPIIFDVYQRLISSKNTKYKIGKYRIEIPPNFALPGFQKKFKLYDRFLPVLVSKFEPEKTIIDVGANVGDTTIAMIQKCKNRIICIEPSLVFLPFLEKNLSKLPFEDQQKTAIIKKLVGTGSISGELTHTNGSTAHVRIVEGANTHTPLDDLITDIANVILLKVDTDGFDFDVIRSAQKILSASEPILYWENEIAENFQYKGFDELYVFLAKHGYCYIYVFDNFGNLITEEHDFETLKNINTYIYSMKKNECTRTIYYVDVLAVTKKNYLVVKNAIDTYKTEWIKK